jgi:hypothetical protein
MQEIIFDDYMERSSGSIVFGQSQILDTIESLGLPQRSYVIIGGANLVLRGVRQLTPDIDMLVSDNALEKLRTMPGAKVKKPPYAAIARGAINETVAVEFGGQVPVSATTSMLGQGYYPQTFKGARQNTETILAVPCVSLDEVIASKTALRRPKDLTDLGRIAAFLGQDLPIPSPRVDEYPDFHN